MNENKRIDNSQIKIAQWVGAKAQDGKMRWNMITKTIMGIIFNFQNSHSSTWSLPTKEIFRVNGQIGLYQIFQLPIFALSREKCCYQSHRIRNFRFFFSYTGFLSLLGKFERYCLQVIRIFQCRHNPRKFPQTTLDWEWWRLWRSFINRTEWHERRVTFSRWLAISNTLEKYGNFSRVLLRHFSRLEILL